MRVLYGSATWGWIIAVIITFLSFVLLIRRSTDTAGEAPTPFAIIPRIPMSHDPPSVVGMPHHDATSLAVVSFIPTPCVDECLEEEFWKSLQEGWA